MRSKTGRAPMVTDASADSSLSRLLLLERCNGTHATLAVLAAPGVAAGAPGVTHAGEPVFWVGFFNREASGL